MRKQNENAKRRFGTALLLTEHGPVPHWLLYGYIPYMKTATKRRRGTLIVSEVLTLIAVLMILLFGKGFIKGHYRDVYESCY